MTKIIKLKESDIKRIVKKVVKEDTDNNSWIEFKEKDDKDLISTIQYYGESQAEDIVCELVSDLGNNRVNVLAEIIRIIPNNYLEKWSNKWESYDDDDPLYITPEVWDAEGDDTP